MGKGLCMTQQTMSAAKYRYRIVVRGRVDGIHRALVEGLRIDPDGPNTALVATVDRATLHRTLDRLYSASLELVAIRRLDGDCG
jgi:hypothetical protein